MWTGVLLGTIGAISAEAWPIIWLRMEINLISFLMLLSISWSTKKTCMIYFVVQRVGSLLILRRGLASDIKRLMASWVTLGLLIKIRIAPLHFWGAVLIGKLKGLLAYIFLTWQKMAPIFLLLVRTPKLLIIRILLINITVRSRCAIGRKNIFVLLFFSGLMHACWLISSRVSRAYQYFLMYSLISLPLFILTHNQPILFFNLAGLPPLTGFFMKLNIIQLVNPRWGIMLLLFSAVVLYSYLRVFLFSAYKQNSSINIFTVIVCGFGLLLV